MQYSIEISPRARKDLRKLDARSADRILLKIADMANDLAGDVKHLTNFEPEYRLRVGDFRVLFDLEDTKIIVRRIKIVARHTEMSTTIELHPEFLRKDGEPEFAVLPYAEYQALQEWLEDVEDMLDLREARKEDEGQSNFTIEDVRKELGI